MTKFVFALLVLFCSVTPVLAQDHEQEHEISLWSRAELTGPWYVFTAKNKAVLDTRYNVDKEKTLTVCGGKKFGSEKFAVIPEVCGYFGKSKGFGPEFWILSETEKIYLESYIQYAKLQKDESFTYAEGRLERRIKRLALGGATEMTAEKGHIKVSLGASTRFNFTEKFVVHFVPMWTVTHHHRGDKVFYLGFVLRL